MKKYILLLIAIFVINIANAQQYSLAGTASSTGSGCYNLTNTTDQAGAAWNAYKVNLHQAFDITISLNFGNRPDINYDGGANCGGDGISFVLQPSGPGVFGGGGGVGFNGINPSIGVVMDNYSFNTTDPTYPHISINKNGDETHTTYTPAGICPPTGVVSVYNPNELASYCSAVGLPAAYSDGLDHLFHIVWTPTLTGTGTLKVYFGTATTLPITPTISYTGNLVDSIFSGDPNVYWGISASTGSCWNSQSFCEKTIANFACDSVICTGPSITFINNSVSTLPITTYSWDFGDGGHDSVQFPSPHIYSDTGIYFVSLYIQNSGGLSSTMTHTIHILPALYISVNSDTICDGTFATLIATGADAFTWDNGLYWGATKVVNPHTTTSYVVTATSSAGCIVTDTAVVTVLPAPIVNVNSAAVCLGDTVILTVTGNALSYQWANGDTNLVMVVSPTTSTNYIITGVNQYGCETSKTAAVTVSPKPPTPVVANIGFMLLSDATTGNQWYNLTTGIINNATGVNYTPQQSGDYYVISTPVIGCSSDTSNIVYFYYDGIGESKMINHIAIYPNPAKEELTIETNLNTEQRIEIVNLIGQTVYTSSSINNKTIINTTAFANGVYILKLYTAKETMVRKFIKE